MPMTIEPRQAVELLQGLVSDAHKFKFQMYSVPSYKIWGEKATLVLTRSLGKRHPRIEEFNSILQRPLSFADLDTTGRQNMRIRECLEIIDLAIFELNIAIQNKDSIPEGGNYDPGLWEHVQHSVIQEKWEQVASEAAIYLENKIRQWSGSPKDTKGGALVGQALFAKAFAESSPLALGAQANETSGWQSLGMGFVAALGNVVRHQIQERPDARQYAIGILGLSSLLLTQLKYQHPDIIKPST